MPAPELATPTVPPVPAVRPFPAAPRPARDRVLAIETRPEEWHALTRAAAGVAPTDWPQLVATAGHRLLPPTVHEALVGLPQRTGAHRSLLVRGAPTSTGAPTPAHPDAATDKDATSELVVLAVARALGEPVGYSAEHGGALVQNLVPTRDGADRQTSTSSAVELEFHTETAFHPHRPRHLVLGCVRGDRGATTLLCAVDDVVRHLDPEVLDVLWQPRFRTRVDESFGGGRDTPPGPPVAVLSGDPAAPTLLYDANLMDGTDPDSAAALARFTAVARRERRGVVLDTGDVLVVDNHACIHGRSPFAPRHDGTDRWLQRSFVVADLSPSCGERRGRIITTTFPSA